MISLLVRRCYSIQTGLVANTRGDCSYVSECQSLEARLCALNGQYWNSDLSSSMQSALLLQLFRMIVLNHDLAIDPSWKTILKHPKLVLCNLQQGLTYHMKQVAMQIQSSCRQMTPQKNPLFQNLLLQVYQYDVTVECTHDFVDNSPFLYCDHPESSLILRTDSIGKAGVVEDGCNELFIVLVSRRFLMHIERVLDWESVTILLWLPCSNESKFVCTGVGAAWWRDGYERGRSQIPVTLVIDV